MESYTFPVFNLFELITLTTEERNEILNKIEKNNKLFHLRLTIKPDKDFEEDDIYSVDSIEFMDEEEYEEYRKNGGTKEFIKKEDFYKL